MGISIQTNYANLVAQNTLLGTNGDLTKSLERLSTGFRINSASDDAAGLQIANRLEYQNRGMGVAASNAQNAISMMQTAEGALDEATNIAFRMNDLATQASNATTSTEDKKAITTEFVALNTELSSIMNNTSFGDQKVLGAAGAFGTGKVSFQVGATVAEKLDVDISTAVTKLSTDAATLGALDFEANAGDADTAIGSVKTLINDLSSVRSSFGANVNRLEHTITNLGNMQEQTANARSRIMDTDFASESAAMSKSQMLMQAGASMLGASKMSSQLAMSMLG